MTVTVVEVCPTCGRGTGDYWVFPGDWVPVPPWWRADHPTVRVEEANEEASDDEVAGRRSPS